MITGFFGGMGGCAMIGQTLIKVKVSGPRTRISTFLAGVLVLVVGFGFGDAVTFVVATHKLAIGVGVGVLVASSNDLYTQFEYADDPGRIIIGSTSRVPRCTPACQASCPSPLPRAVRFGQTRRLETSTPHHSRSGLHHSRIPRAYLTSERMSVHRPMVIGMMSQTMLVTPRLAHSVESSEPLNSSPCA